MGFESKKSWVNHHGLWFWLNVKCLAKPGIGTTFRGVKEKKVRIFKNSETFMIPFTLAFENRLPSTGQSEIRRLRWGCFRKSSYSNSLT